MEDDDGSDALLAHAESLFSLHAADEILSYVCREARALTGGSLAIGSFVAAGDPWQRGLHVATEAKSPAMISAAFAVHRRVSGKPQPLIGPAEQPIADGAANHHSNPANGKE